MKRWRIVGLAVGLWLCACSSEQTETVYSRYRAFFRYDYVTTALPLYAALGSAGQFCSIYGQGSYLYFVSPTQRQQVNLTSLASYQSFVSISGFIVGQGNVPDMTTGQLPILCFDRACPNCYDEESVTHPLGLHEGGIATCSRCKRTYDLNNLGLIREGEKGKKLFRYRVSYNGLNVLYINNR